MRTFLWDPTLSGASLLNSLYTSRMFCCL